MVNRKISIYNPKLYISIQNEFSKKKHNFKGKVRYIYIYIYE